MYEFLINGLRVTREEFGDFIDQNLLSDELAELFETGSATVSDKVIQIVEADV